MADVTPERVRALLDAAAPGPWRDLARAYLAEHERSEMWRGVWSGSHDSHVRTVDEARAEIAALRERAERAEAEAARLREAATRLLREAHDRLVQEPGHCAICDAVIEMRAALDGGGR